jgi:hypothetical protein
MLRNPSDAHDSVNARSLDEGGNDPNALFCAQAVHGISE